MSEQEVTASERRNEKRRKLYRGDPNYRKQVRSQNRESYRNRSGSSPDKDCSQNLTALSEIGSMRPFVGGDPNEPDLCFTVAETAEALGDYSEQAIYRWIREGQLPKMVYQAIAVLPVNSGGTREAEVAVYTLDEIKALIGVLSEHQKEFNYYTKRHSGTRDKLFAAVDRVRGG